VCQNGAMVVGGLAISLVLANSIAFKCEEFQGTTCDEIIRREFGREAYIDPV